MVTTILLLDDHEARLSDPVSKEANVNVYWQHSHQEDKVADSLPCPETLCFSLCFLPLYKERHTLRKNTLGGLT